MENNNGLVLVESQQSRSSSLIDSNISQTSEQGDGVTTNNNLFIDKDRAHNFLRGFSKLYRNKEFVDVVLSVDGKDFPCHKNVLAISSPFFMAMFSTDMAESHQDKIALHEIDSLTMELVLDYIYTGQVSLSEDTVQHLLSASNRFQLLSLRTGCAEFMMNHITVVNCIGVYFFAKAHECEILALKAKEIINNQFSVLCKQQEFLSLPADKLVEIVSDDDINVTVEETVFEACLEWVMTEKEKRQNHLMEIMNCVRFANITSYYFCDKIDPNTLLRSCESLRKTLDIVRYYHMLRNRQQEMDLNLMPRQGMLYERGVMIIANPYTEDSLKKFNSMELLLPKTGEVISICKLPQSLYTPGCAITGENQVYLAGGAIRKINYRGSITTEGVSNNFYMFDQLECAWQTKAKMNMCRSQFSLTVVDGYMFAIGGQDGTEILSSVERYDPHSNAWMLVAPLPKALRFMTALSYRGRLYVFGGEASTDVSNSVYRYDPTEDTWSELPPMNIARVLAGSVVYKDKIYVIGGNSALSEKWKREFLPEHCVSSVEIFDPESQTWSPGPELPNALCGAGIVKYGNTILIVGGEDDKSWMAGLCWLKEEKGRQTWAEGQELPTVMSTFGCVVANIHHEAPKNQ
ncbi:kelch repeat and BTB domain-containing protein 8-like [Mytilus galloprovincialis]|uniref:kelch repeat and BTB domain-containing protein 8-like n=1 Tax=Mytilus galloprovincialis TaxID=29158 RepID=UPI003F7C168B